MTSDEHDHATYLDMIPPDIVIAHALAILGERLLHGESIKSPDDIWQCATLWLCPEDREVFACIFLDNKNCVITFEKMFYGTIDQATVHPRVILKRALEQNASSIVLLHNHTSSGEPEPSEQDKAVTNRVKEALALVDIRLIDHVIVAHHGYMSFAQKGLLY